MGMPADLETTPHDAPPAGQEFAPPPSARRACRNCNATLTGAYCAQCGQRDAAPDPTLAELLADAWDAFTSLDGKVLSSLRLLVSRPGALTKEYLAGRRARYLPPFRLYLFCSVAFFLVSSIDIERQRTPAEARAAAEAATQRDSIARARIARGEVRDIGPDRDTPFAQRLKRGNERLQASGRKLQDVVRANVPNAMFVIMPAYAALLMLIYRSRRIRFPAHLVFTLHVHAFFFASLAVMEGVELVVDGMMLPARIDTLAELAGIAGMMMYFPIAMRRVYAGRWSATALRAIVLAVVYGSVTLMLLSLAVVGYLYFLAA